MAIVKDLGLVTGPTGPIGATGPIGPTGPNYTIEKGILEIEQSSTNLLYSNYNLNLSEGMRRLGVSLDILSTSRISGSYILIKELGMISYSLTITPFTSTTDEINLTLPSTSPYQEYVILIDLGVLMNPSSAGLSGNYSFLLRSSHSLVYSYGYITMYILTSSSRFYLGMEKSTIDPVSFKFRNNLTLNCTTPFIPNSSII